MNKIAKISIGIVGLVVLVLIAFSLVGNGISENEELNQKEDVIAEIDIGDFEINYNAKYIGNRKFQIDGTAGLPNGSEVSVTVRDEGYYQYDNRDVDWRGQNLTSISAGDIKIQDKRFSAVLVGNDYIAPLLSKNYEVEVRFDPRWASEPAISIVGEKGENLTGDLVHVLSNGIKTLEKTEVISTELPEKLNPVVSEGTEVSYRVIEEDDISYAGCNRVALRIVVPDDASQTNVDFTLTNIVNEHKESWDDITVWAWKESEIGEVGATPATMGMKEYSTCS